MQVLALLLLHPSYAWGLLLFPAVLAEVLAAAFFFFQVSDGLPESARLGLSTFFGLFWAAFAVDIFGGCAPARRSVKKGT